jgi:hypothetical protein
MRGDNVNRNVALRCDQVKNLFTVLYIVELFYHTGRYKQPIKLGKR